MMMMMMMMIHDVRKIYHYDVVDKQLYVSTNVHASDSGERSLCIFADSGTRNCFMRHPIAVICSVHVMFVVR